MHVDLFSNFIEGNTNLELKDDEIKRRNCPLRKQGDSLQYVF
jgi:hypothetical protein